MRIQMSSIRLFVKQICWDFLDGPVIHASNEGGVGSIPGLETKIPHATWSSLGGKKRDICKTIKQYNCSFYKKYANM